jgi:hypothetical protein
VIEQERRIKASLRILGVAALSAMIGLLKYRPHDALAQLVNDPRFPDKGGFPAVSWIFFAMAAGFVVLWVYLMWFWKPKSE